MAGRVEVDADVLESLSRACQELAQDVAATSARHLHGAPGAGDGYGHLPAAAEASEQYASSVRDLEAVVEELRGRCEEHAEHLRTAAARCRETDARAAEEVARLRRRL